MPSGVYDRKPKTILHCKSCEGSQFKTISDLRKHQWAQHPEIFNNALQTRHKRRKKKRRMTVKLSRETALIPLGRSLNGDMSVSDLLGQLKTQQKFMNDVVDLVSNILGTYQQAQKKETK